ncbi:MAG: hypothetical protein MHPDNHAH_01750 [Anaerolineales bacterium]|nr:hypothetical protein [Anaerolineales bacterium]
MIPIDASVSVRADIIQSKRRYGFFFGASLGLLFAIATWGLDSYLLYQAHGLLPWLKLGAGAILCGIAGGIAGGLAARLDNIAYAVLLWMATAVIFAWLIVNLPTRITPRLIEFNEPEIQGLLNYTYYQAFSWRVAVAFAWIVIFVGIMGALQLPLSESAIFSASVGGKIVPVIVLVLVMGICGSLVDNLVNEPLRSATFAINEILQFSIAHEGQEVDPAEARAMHLGSLRGVQELITQEYRLIVSGYDEFFGKVQVLAQFENAWAECTVIYSQPTNCEQVGSARIR